MHKKSASLQGAFFVQHRFIIILITVSLPPPACASAFFCDPAGGY